MFLYDTHTHLNGDELFPQRQDHLSLFIQAGGKGLINSGASEQYNLRGIEIAKIAQSLKSGNKPFRPSDTSPYQGRTTEDIIIKATIGYHPGECSIEEPSIIHTEIITEENVHQKIAGLKALYEANKQYVVAIGECGIDTYFPGTEQFLPIQKTLFALQCNLAQELNLPLVIHVRKDFASAREILKRYHNLTIHFHCRGFGPEEMETLLMESGKLGWKLFIGFCGNITYKNAQNLRDSLIKVPLNQLLLETDAPWLSPQIVRGTMNHPANIKYIYDFVAELLKITPEALSQQLEANFHCIYKS